MGASPIPLTPPSPPCRGEGVAAAPPSPIGDSLSPDWGLDRACGPRWGEGVLTGAFLLVFASIADAQDLRWQTLEPGLDLARVAAVTNPEAGDGVVTIVRADLKRFRLVLHMARFEDEKSRTAAGWARDKALVAAVNAGLYQQDHSTAVGLLVDGRRVNNPKLNDYRSVLAFNPESGDAPAAALIDRGCERDADLKRYATLVQNIRVIDCRRRVTWRGTLRSVSLGILGLDGAGRVIVAFSASPHRTDDFAKLLLRLPLDLRRAQYLEGGRPAQLYVSAGGTTVSLNGLCGSLGCIGRAGDAPAIPNVIGLSRRRPRRRRARLPLA